MRYGRDGVQIGPQHPEYSSGPVLIDSSMGPQWPANASSATGFVATLGSSDDLI